MNKPYSECSWKRNRRNEAPQYCMRKEKPRSWKQRPNSLNSKRLPQLRRKASCYSSEISMHSELRLPKHHAKLMRGTLQTLSTKLVCRHSCRSYWLRGRPKRSSQSQPWLQLRAIPWPRQLLLPQSKSAKHSHQCQRREN